MWFSKPLIKLKPSDVLISKHSSNSGYFMVMKMKNDKVILSPLFWKEKIIYITYHFTTINDYYKHIDKELKLGNSVIKARYDHEYMRRINKL